MQDFLKPNKKNIISTGVIFLICSFLSWIPRVQILLKFSSSTSGVFNFNNIIYLSIILLISYFLATIFSYYFNWKYIKKIPLSLKLIIVFLLLKLFSAIYFIISNIRPGSGNNFFQASKLFFSNTPTLYLILLITSIVFLSIKIKYNWIFGSFFFLYLLFNPMSQINSIFAQGSLISSFQGILLGDLTTAIIMFTYSLFYIITVIYLITVLRKNSSSSKLEKTTFILLIILYLINNLNLATVVFGGYGFKIPFINLLLFFGLLFSWYYYSKKAI